MEVWKADWGESHALMVLNLSLDDDIDLCCDRLNSIIIKAAEDSLLKS